MDRGRNHWGGSAVGRVHCLSQRGRGFESRQMAWPHVCGCVFGPLREGAYANCALVDAMITMARTEHSCYVSNCPLPPFLKIKKKGAEEERVAL